ncbi:HU family DNA-binding protein [Sphingomonas sp. 1P06PA]|uniref:HU family DNA-binding protein n=1 Tax=Sphingomonas sp. 1P06PA TaxID=554121 RepID=UPI0039A69700
MTHSELVARLALENPGLSKKDVRRIVDLFFEAIIEQLVASGRVELRGFGSFSTRVHIERKWSVRGRAFSRERRRNPYFRTSDILKRRLT